MAVSDAELSTLVRGTTDRLPEATKAALEQSILDLSKNLERTRNNITTKQSLSGGITPQQIKLNGSSDTEAFTTISEMINGNTKDFAGFGTLLDNLYAKNKKYFTIIKDYEIMPILIPQINRVLSFLVNECLSPDIQNEQTFIIKYTGQSNNNSVQADIDAIKKEMKLDHLLREVYTNRYKLGREYYMVQDYNATFSHMLEMLQKKRMNEDTAGMSDIQYIDSVYSGLTGVINEVSGKASVTIVKEEKSSTMTPATYQKDSSKSMLVENGSIDLNLSDLNVVVERSPIIRMMEDVQAELIAESYRKYSTKNLLGSNHDQALNEAVIVDTSKLEQIAQDMAKKNIQRCSIIRFDPAKLFKLKIGGKVIGYLHVTDINEGSANMVNFSQALKDQLLKSRATNLAAATESAEEVIAKELATRILNTFDPNLGINRVEDIDLMHDFIRNNEIYKGNKRITFYYADEIFDMSRADDSILVNAVFFTKLYSTLLLNNIVTKVLRGRGRQIHTVKMGASPNVQRYIDNAMAALAMPEHNLGTLHGSFEQIMNPFNGASDIVIPTEEDDTRYITTDYIPGQDVDMNDDFLKTLLNNIVVSFNLDSAVLDATNGNLQFARSLTMESLQISNSVRNEQQDVYDPWSAMCFEVLRIMGNDDTRTALNNNQIEVKFFEPKSLIIQNTIDDLNNVKNLVESIADLIPAFNAEDSEQWRAKFVYTLVRAKSNYDFTEVDEALKETSITKIDDALTMKIQEIIREYLENVKEVPYGQGGPDDDGMGEEGEEGAEPGDEGSGMELEEGEGDEDDELSPEEQELMGMPEEGDEDEE